MRNVLVIDALLGSQIEKILKTATCGISLNSTAASIADVFRPSVGSKDGSRYDRATVATDKNNIMPRVGLVYKLAKKTVCVPATACSIRTWKIWAIVNTS